MVDATSPPTPSLVRAASSSRPASAASSRTVATVAGASIRAPRVGEGQRAGVELGQQAERVHLERRRVDDPLEAVGRDVVAARDRQPVLRVAVGQPQDRADDLAEHRPEVGARVLGVVDLGAEPGLADREAAGDGRRRHPDVDAEPADVGRPVVELEVVPDEVAGDAEVAADRLADAMAVERPRQRVGDRVGDRAVVLVAGVERRDEVVAALEDRARPAARSTRARSSAGPSRRRPAPGPRARRRSRRSSAARRPCRRRRRSRGRSG